MPALLVGAFAKSDSCRLTPGSGRNEGPTPVSALNSCGHNVHRRRLPDARMHPLFRTGRRRPRHLRLFRLSTLWSPVTIALVMTD